MLRGKKKVEEEEIKCGRGKKGLRGGKKRERNIYTYNKHFKIILR